MNRQDYFQIMARKIGYDHLLGMSTQEAKTLLESQGKEVTIAPWNQREDYLEDGIFVENQVNLVSKDDTVWAVSLGYDNAII
jgi:hypothetical protein